VNFVLDDPNETTKMPRPYRMFVMIDVDNGKTGHSHVNPSAWSKCAIQLLPRTGAESRRRDYFDKRNQYEWRGILEYWIVDPQAECVTVLAMVEGAYTETVFNRGDTVVSPTFPQWKLTVEEMLQL